MEILSCTPREPLVSSPSTFPDKSSRIFDVRHSDPGLTTVTFCDNPTLERDFSRSTEKRRTFSFLRFLFWYRYRDFVHKLFLFWKAGFSFKLGPCVSKLDVFARVRRELSPHLDFRRHVNGSPLLVLLTHRHVHHLKKLA